MRHSEVNSLNMAIETELAAFTHARNGRRYSLTQVEAGYEIAGSGVRYVDDCWRVRFVLRDGTRGSRAYLTEAEARANYAKCLES